MNRTIYLQVLAETIKAQAKAFDPNVTPSPEASHAFNPEKLIEIKNPVEISSPKINRAPSSMGKNIAVQKMQATMHDLISKISQESLIGVPEETVNALKSLITASQNKPALFQADGFWGPITNQVLQKIADLAVSLTILPINFRLPNDIYPPAIAKELQTSIPTIPIEGKHVKLSQEEQTEYASKIVANLTDIEKLFTYLSNKIPHISNEGILRHDEQQIVKSNATVPIIAGEIQMSIPLSVLISPSAFNQFITDRGLEPLKDEILESLINLPNTLKVEAK
jgi:hypothetical protein